MITKENFEKYKKTSYDNTVRSLRISFVIGEIAKQEAIKVRGAGAAKEAYQEQKSPTKEPY